MGCCQWLGMQYHLRRWQKEYHELLGLGDPKCKLCTETGQGKKLGHQLEFDVVQKDVHECQRQTFYCPEMTQRASRVRQAIVALGCRKDLHAKPYQKPI